MKQKTILIVDDDEVVRLTLAKTLKRGGFKVLTAADGREALNVDMQNISLLITDVFMPGVSGIRLLLELKRQGWEVKTLLITSACPDILKELFVKYELPICAILQKPLLDTNIMDVVNKLIRN